ncbi:hypothetical protein BJF80_13600 [Serinicoccus sp. CUA-874]|uniref:hypothetical protein n=1 Tax=Serinicoccus sp. CUA-874 TaxID=1517939 RepID=UPI000960B1B1|nr:hypothetical protein [Serinicoccus sp. CUA-874]OLT19065.1 hypothetical protein BJF80_13600 [Serinicoccus sp. CUA-874]
MHAEARRLAPDEGHEEAAPVVGDPILCVCRGDLLPQRPELLGVEGVDHLVGHEAAVGLPPDPGVQRANDSGSPRRGSRISQEPDRASALLAS